MNSLSLQKISNIILCLMLIFSFVFGYSTLRSSEKFSQIEASWSSFKSQNNEKARLHRALYGVLGYGGMIHNFKNYIVRKDFALFLETERSLGAAKSVVQQYIALSTSPAEKLALTDILSMLDTYQNNLNLAREEVNKGSASALIDSLVKVDDALALRGLKILADEIVAEHPYFENEANKPVLASIIRAELGYGGMIHGLKNYLLRAEEHYKHIALTAIAKIRITIDTFGGLKIPSGEKTALDDILRTLEIYESKIDLIAQGVEKKLSPEEIDSMARVDDSYALRGLRTLDQDVINQIDDKSEQLSILLKELRDRERINTIIVLCSTLFIAVFIFFIFSRRVIQPVKNMSEVMLEMAHGNLDRLTEKDDNDEAHIKTELGKMQMSLGVFRNNEIKRREAEQEIRHLALTDPLTGLANRNQLNKRFCEMLALAKRENRPLILLAFDLDNFKPINDEYGHSAGDLVLKSVARNMLTTFRETDVVARLGGDEFVVVMYGSENISGAVKAVERLINLVNSPVPFGKDLLSVGISVGIAEHHCHEDSLEISIQQADKALYEAKKRGKNTFHVHGSNQTPGSIN